MREGNAHLADIEKKCNKKLGDNILFYIFLVSFLSISASIEQVSLLLSVQEKSCSRDVECGVVNIFRCKSHEGIHSNRHRDREEAIGNKGANVAAEFDIRVSHSTTEKRTLSS